MLPDSIENMIGILHFPYSYPGDPVNKRKIGKYCRRNGLLVKHAILKVLASTKFVGLQAPTALSLSEIYKTPPFHGADERFKCLQR